VRKLPTTAPDALSCTTRGLRPGGYLLLEAARVARAPPSSRPRDKELYEFNTSTLTVTPLSAGNGGGVDGKVNGVISISNDGSHVYYAAGGTGVPHESRGPASHGRRPQPLPVRHDERADHLHATLSHTDLGRRADRVLGWEVAVELVQRLLVPNDRVEEILTGEPRQSSRAHHRLGVLFTAAHSICEPPGAG